MLIKDKKHFTMGAALAISFLIVLVIMFSPVFNGENALQAADRLFNSIAKGSTYYFSGLLKKNEKYRETKFEATLKLTGEDMANKASKLLTQAGIGTTGSGEQLKVIGYLGQVLEAALKDSEAMFNNRGKEIADKYGFPEKEVLYTWWKIFAALGKELEKQKSFAQAAFVADVVKKGVEVGYNFYAIDPEQASAKAGILSFALVFYVVYTLWWGYGIFFLFEGIGLKMKAGKKKEV
jgi:hypothetical protein